MNDAEVLKLSAWGTASRCWGLRGREPWSRMIR
jgi:hypothetical protein